MLYSIFHSLNKQSDHILFLLFIFWLSNQKLYRISEHGCNYCCDTLGINFRCYRMHRLWSMVTLYFTTRRVLYPSRWNNWNDPRYYFWDNNWIGLAHRRHIYCFLLGSTQTIISYWTYWQRSCLRNKSRESR